VQEFPIVVEMGMSQDGGNDGNDHGRQMLPEVSVPPRVGAVLITAVVSVSIIIVTVGRDREVVVYEEAVVITRGRSLIHKAVALVVAFAGSGRIAFRHRARGWPLGRSSSY